MQNRLLDLLQKSFSSIDGTGKMPIPQELFFLVGWASCPSYLFLQEVYCIINSSCYFVNFIIKTITWETSILPMDYNSYHVRSIAHNTIAGAGL